MKTLTDGTQVAARVYYYLLDFNECTNWKYICEELNKKKLHELNKNEFIALYQHAINIDLQILKEKGQG
jgi:hypothetical protein